MPTVAITPLSKPVNATIRVPGSKSHTNRALVCAALAQGRSRLSGVLFANDTWAMLKSLQVLGLNLDIDESACSVEIEGCGGELPALGSDLVRIDVRQSGTTGRFLLPVLTLAQAPPASHRSDPNESDSTLSDSTQSDSTQASEVRSTTYVLDGDPQLRARPFGELITSLHSLGAVIEGTTLPLSVGGQSGLRGGIVSLGGDVSSQYLSGLLLSAPCAQTDVVIELTSELVSKPYIDLTIKTMTDFGAEVINDGYRRFVVPATGYKATDSQIEPDASAASYFFAAAAITRGSVTVPGLGTQTIQGDLDFVDVLARMGATVTKTATETTVVGPDQLKGIEVDMSNISDTAQSLATVAPFADGPTRVTGIGFIRKKETDRIGAVVQELSRLGIRATEEDDGFLIEPGTPSAGLVATYDDHRMAMSFAVLGLVSPGIVIEDPGCVAKTFPTFFSVLDQLEQT